MPEAGAHPLNICLVTDVFPPNSGGSGWSTYYLGKAMAERGNNVRVLRPVYGAEVSSATTVTYGGLEVHEVPVPPAPNWTARFGLRRAWEERQAIKLLTRKCQELTLEGRAHILHGQHYVSALAVSRAARQVKASGVSVASVATVRDYWPLCPVSTRLIQNRGGKLSECRDCHRFGTYISCLGKRRGSKLVSAVGAIRWLRTRAAARELARCDAVIAVSDYVHRELKRSGRFDPVRLHTVHNLVDLPSVEQALGQPFADGLPPGTFLLFVGKLDEHKGADLLPSLVAASGLGLPVVIAGDGPLQAKIEREARQRSLDFRFMAWLDNNAVLRLMRDARCLLFPSHWQEPLSRVLLEGCAAGAAIVALDTGGTRDVITHSVSGWLADSRESFVQGVRAVCLDDELNARLRKGGRTLAEGKFSTPVVARQVEQLYCAVLG